MTDEEIKKVALGIFKGEIFTNLQIAEGQEAFLAPMIFLPLGLMDQKAAKRFMRKKPFMLYGYMTDTFSRSINGYPIFSKMGYTNKADAKKIWDKVKEIKSAVENVKPGG